MSRRTRIALALAALLGFAWGPVLGLPADADHTSPSWARGLPPCEYEDGSGGPLPCYWDAGNAGNGRGRSYIIRADGSTDYAAADPGPYCQFDVFGHEVWVGAYRAEPGDRVAARVNGRTLRGKLGPRGFSSWVTKGSYTQDDVRVRVNGRLCEGT